MGDAYDYYSEMDYADLAEMFGETAEEIEPDFSAWYDKHSDKLETDYVNLFIDECFGKMKNLSRNGTRRIVE